MNLLKVLFVFSLVNLGIFCVIAAMPKPKATTVAVVLPTSTLITTSPSPSQAPKPTTPPVQPTADTRCLITIDGQRYDMTQFRNLHSGGDIFQCGTDMTNIFYQQHNQGYLSKIQKYKI